MPTKKEKIFPNLSLNPHNIKVGDTVVKDNKIGLVTDIVNNNGNKVLQFWVKWAQASATAPTPELASSLQKIDPIPHDLVNTTFPDHSFVESFVYRDNQPKAIITKESGFFSLISIDQLNNKLQQPTHPTINIYSLTIDPNLQQRVKLNQDTAYDYSIALSEGEIFPPIIIWRCDDGKIYLVDGFHRVEAAKLAKMDELPYSSKSGSYREAMLFTISVNADHGLQRSNADKRKAVMTLLQDTEWSQLSTRELAKLAKVSHQLVHKMRIEIIDIERRQKNWQSVKEYEKRKDKIETVNDSQEKQYLYPEDAIKFLDDEVNRGMGNSELGTGNSEQIVNIYTNKIEEKQPPPKINSPPNYLTDISLDVLHISKDTFSILIDRNTITELEKFMIAEDITNVQDALRQLLNFYQRIRN